MVSSAPVRQRRKDARPQELLDAALHLFVEKGFASTRAEEVATRAGVSKGTLYLYYASKAELLKAVIRQNLSQLIADGANLVDQFEGTTPQLMSRLLEIWWERVGHTPASGIHKIILTEVRNFPDIASFYNNEVVRPAEALLRRTLERGVSRGEFRPMPVREITTLLFAPMVFMALHEHTLGACVPDEQPLDPMRTMRTQVDLILHGLLTPQAAAALPIEPVATPDFTALPPATPP